MRTLTLALAIAVMTILALGAPAGAQDVIGELVADPETVPEAGEYEITASASGMIPDTDVLLGVCVSPAAELVPGVSTEEDVIAAAVAIEIIADCDIANALLVSVDSSGNFSETVTVTVGPNTFLSAGDVAGTQAAAVWVPIVSAQPTLLADTGAETSLLLLVGLALIGLGGLAMLVSRRFDTV